MLLEREDGTLWAWLGARRRIDPKDVLRLASSHLADDQAFAVGEPGEGISGWRLTHLQAAAALTAAQRGQQSPVRYADVALLASALQDDLLISSLRSLFLEPLERERDRGSMAFETLRAYFAAERNAASAAAALGVTRQAVTGRLRAIEGRLGHPISDCATELEVALSIAR